MILFVVYYRFFLSPNNLSSLAEVNSETLLSMATEGFVCSCDEYPCTLTPSYMHIFFFQLFSNHTLLFRFQIPFKTNSIPSGRHPHQVSCWKPPTNLTDFGVWVWNGRPNLRTVSFPMPAQWSICRFRKSISAHVILLGKCCLPHCSPSCGIFDSPSLLSGVF